MKIYSANSSQRAFTLIELMIAMLIGVFLIAGVIQIFLSAKQAYRLQENLSRLQENGRFAMDIITKDIRSAGFMGCSKFLPIARDTTLPTITELTKINGNDSIANNWTSTAWNANPNKGTTGPCGASNECIVGTDAISFQFAKSCGGQLTTSMATASANVQIGASNSCSISAGDQLLIADCTVSDVFLAKTGSTSTSIIPPNTSPLLTKAYVTNAELFTFQSISYFIRAGASGVPSLYRVDNTKAVSGSTNPVELIEGIENMQILYGVDTDQTPDYVPNFYVDASAVANLKIPATGPLGTIATNDSTGNAMNPAPSSWTRVVSVRINLLAVTIDNNLTDTPQPYFYNNATTNPPQISVVKTDTSQLCPPSGTNCQLVDDRRIHRVFSSTIAVRNRLP